MVERGQNVVKTILQMFNQRGYTDISEEENCIIATKPNGAKIYAFPSIVEKLNVSVIHNYIAILQKAEINHGIIVFEGIPTPAVKNVVSNTPDLDINIELFQADDLQFNITEHKLVPTHILLSKNEAKAFKEKYGTNIPILLRTDAIVRFYDFAKGDIIKIVRRNGFISYRIVR